MRRNIASTNLTKDFIESKVSQELIVSKYLNIPIDVVKDCIEHNHLISSVFRNDDYNKSMGIQYNKKGRLKIRDFGGYGFFEDVYGVVAHVLSIIYNRKIDCNNKQDFYFILKHIAQTFSSYVYGSTIDENMDEFISNAINVSKKRRAIIEVANRPWNKDDKRIWNKYGVNLNELGTHFVYAVDQYYINRGPNSEPKYRYNPKDPCYAYVFGQDRTGITLIKLYFPLRDRKTELKFITNCCVLEGILNLERNDYDYILITKSTKDRLSLETHLSNNSFYGGSEEKLKIGIVNLPSEIYKLTTKEYDYLSQRINYNGVIISLVDFDKTGRECAKYLNENYNIPYIFITRGEFGLENYHAKDFADLHQHFNNNQINNFIKNTISYVEEKYKFKYTSIFD